MKILYLHQYFKTPYIPGCNRSYWNSLRMVNYGHDVTVISGRKDNSKLIEKEYVDGISIIYIKITYSNHMNIFQRLIAFVKFMVLSSVVAIKERNTDLVIATSTPLSVGFPALLLKKVKNIPFVFEVRDLWPEVPIQMGAIKNKIVIKFLRWFEKTIYENASHVITLSPGMREGVLNVLADDSKISMIPNMAKIDTFGKRRVNPHIAEKLKLNNTRFKAIYFGALGRANAIDFILDAARILKDDDSIEINFIGHGAMIPKIFDFIKKHHLKNVRYLGVFNMIETADIVALSDVSLVTFADYPILYTNSPNKLFDSLSAGKPIIVNSNGWTKLMIENFGCGKYVDPNSPEQLAEALISLSKDKKLTREMGLNSRKLAETKYDKSILCEEFLNVINSVIKHNDYPITNPN